MVIRSIEVDELIMFVHASTLQPSLVDISVPLKRICDNIDDTFLKNRAAIYRDAFEHDDEFNNALRCLSSICNNETCQCEECPIKKYCNYYINQQRNNVDDSALKIVDLFCGAGGLSLGFKQEGFITSLANDIQECCIDTYSHNHPETPRDNIILGDINSIIEDVNELLRYSQVDVVIGGPPCQGFSEANRQRLIDDPRNHLYKSFIQIVQKVSPKFIVMENVKGMMKVKDQVIEDFASIGYQTKAYVLNAMDFGVPQNRERLIYIGNRIGIDNEQVFKDIFVLGNTIPNYYLGDALFGLRELKASRIKNSTGLDTEESGRKIERNQCMQLNSYLELINMGKPYFATCNHKARYNNDRDIEIFGRMLPGDKSDDPKIADIMPYASRNDIFKDKYYKLDSTKVSKTITAHMKFDCNMYIHPTQARGLTPREAARVQSYPDDYYFRGAYTKTYMQIGNSVPPLLGRAIAKVIKNYLIQ